MKINHIIDEAVSAKFLNPQATAQDPGLEREKDVDVIIFGRMPQDFTFGKVVQALEDVLPREYPPGSSQNTQGVPESPAERIGGKIAKNGGAVVTTKPLSTAQKLVKTFQARGIKCKINAPGLEEEVDRRGFLKGLGAAAVSMAIPKQSKSQIIGGGEDEAKNAAILAANAFYSLCKNTNANLAKEIYDVLYNRLMQFYTYSGGSGLPVAAEYSLNVAVSSVKPTFQTVYQMAEKDKEDSSIAKAYITGRLGLGQVSRDEQLKAAGSLERFNLKGLSDQFVKAYTQGLQTVLTQWQNQPGSPASNVAGRNQQPKESVQQGVAEGRAGLPDPNNFDSDNDYRNALDAYGKPQDMDADYENMTNEPDDWFDESREKVGNMDADAFDDALSRMKKLAGAGPLRTVYDPKKRVYKNVPHAVQPAQQPKKAR